MASAASAVRVGLLGGSFDPPHRAHLALARCALRALSLDAVWLIPAGQPWQRAPLRATAEQRWDMLQLLLEGASGLCACDLELRRDGPSYTVDTVRELLRRHHTAAFTLIVGADQLANLCTWHDWPALAAMVDVAAAARPGHALEPPAALLQALRQSGHTLRQLPLSPLSLSATAARQARGPALRAIVPAAVARYIEQHHLYSNQPAPPHGHP